MKKWKFLTMTAMVSSALLLGACGGEKNEAGTNAGNIPQQAENGEAQLAGSVTGDGSSTVAPIVEALVEESAKRISQMLHEKLKKKKLKL